MSCFSRFSITLAKLAAIITRSCPSTSPASTSSLDTDSEVSFPMVKSNLMSCNSFCSFLSLKTKCSSSSVELCTFCSLDIGESLSGLSLEVMVREDLSSNSSSGSTNIKQINCQRITTLFSITNTLLFYEC